MSSDYGTVLKDPADRQTKNNSGFQTIINKTQFTHKSKLTKMLLTRVLVEDMTPCKCDNQKVDKQF